MSCFDEETDGPWQYFQDFFMRKGGLLLCIVFLTALNGFAREAMPPIYLFGTP
jgi:hypothetical protein